MPFLLFCFETTRYVADEPQEEVQQTEMLLVLPSTFKRQPAATNENPYIKGPKRQFFLHVFTIFSRITQFEFSGFFEFFEGFVWFCASFRAVYLNFPSFFAGPGPGPGGTGPGPGPGACEEGWKMFFFFRHGFFKPLTSLKGLPKRQFFVDFLYFFRLFSKY